MAYPPEWRYRFRNLHRHWRWIPSFNLKQWYVVFTKTTPRSGFQPFPDSLPSYFWWAGHFKRLSLWVIRWWSQLKQTLVCIQTRQLRNKKSYAIHKFVIQFLQQKLAQPSPFLDWATPSIVGERSLNKIEQRRNWRARISLVDFTLSVVKFGFPQVLFKDARARQP